MIPKIVKDSVDAYMAARAYAEIIRKNVDKIAEKILAEKQYREHPRLKNSSGKVITKVGDAWRMSDKDHKEFVKLMELSLIEAGYKLEYLTDKRNIYACPARTAERLRCDAEELLINAGAEMIQIPDPYEFSRDLAYAGKEKRQEFIDMICKMVVNQEGYENQFKVGGNREN